ncbi:MAG TPA: adenine deaminase C-terminal domain-containing protein [Thermaerobacter sp.]
MGDVRSRGTDWRDESPQSRQHAVDVAMGRRPPDVWFRGGTVLNVFTGEWERAEVWVAGHRIAYVGPDEPRPGPGTEIVDCRDRYLVPGYIEVHAHPFQLYSPRALAAAIVPRGTTTLVSDTLLLWQVLGPELHRALEARLAPPLRELWGLRAAPQTVMATHGEAGTDDAAFAAAFGLPAREAARLLDHPRVVQVFEWTNWVATVRGGAPAPHIVSAGLARDLPVDGHAPGASYRTLAALAAAGVTDCHESIRAQEVVDRVRLGFFAILRHSSLRPDLPELVAAAREAFARGFGHRLALTTDGPTPAFLRNGFLDHVLGVAFQLGLEPAHGYRMVTNNPATYLGLDRYLGAIAPGRLADVNILRDPSDPRPVEVWVEGRRVALDGQLVEPQPAVDWPALGLGRRHWPLPRQAEEWAYRPAPAAPAGHGRSAQVPVIELLNAVITRLAERELPLDAGGRVVLPPGEDLLFAALVDPARRRISRALVAGFGAGVAGLASTYTVADGLLVLGRDPEAMMQAARVATGGGGIALADGSGVIFHLPLPIAGSMTDMPVEELAGRCDELARLLRERGHRFHDPIYSLLFLTADHLPGPRLTPAGLWDVKRGRLLEPSQPVDLA